MKPHLRSLYVPFLTALYLFLNTAAADELPVVKPGEVGMSAPKLAKVDGVVEKLVDEKRLAGAIVMVVRHGKVVKFAPYGLMDIEQKRPMRTDAVLRFYSMTKAITSAAALVLQDEGKLNVDDPVSKYVPEFNNLNVLTANGEIPTERPVTVADLLRHTSGLTYGVFGNSRVDEAYRNANVLDPNSTIEEMCGKLSRLPLVFQPGKGWSYGVSIDVVGRVVEVASGKPLDQFFRERIFKPLDMKDTGFAVREDQLPRYAQVYNSDGQGTLSVGSNEGTANFVRPRRFLSGGGGLVSTARDYMRFLVMVQNGGELFGKRVLSEKSVRLMTTNQLPKDAGWVRFGPLVREGVGFGLGFAVRVKESAWDPGARLGEYGWGGLASTHYWVSKKDDLCVITLEQTLPYSFLTEFAVKGLIYDAIED